MTITTALTLTALLDFVSAGFLFVGIFFMFLGAVGIVRFPDCYSKMHASSKCTTLGLTGMLLAACLHLGDTIVVSKAIVTVIFTFVAMPIGSHLLAKAAHHVGAPMWDRTIGDELAQDKLDPSKAASDSEMGVWESQATDQTAEEQGDPSPIRAA